MATGHGERSANDFCVPNAANNAKPNASAISKKRLGIRFG